MHRSTREAVSQGAHVPRPLMARPRAGTPPSAGRSPNATDRIVSESTDPTVNDRPRFDERFAVGKSDGSPVG